MLQNHKCQINIMKVIEGFSQQLSTQVCTTDILKLHLPALCSDNKFCLVKNASRVGVYHGHALVISLKTTLLMDRRYHMFSEGENRSFCRSFWCHATSQRYNHEKQRFSFSNKTSRVESLHCK